jgi:hypothetical protein
MPPSRMDNTVVALRADEEGQLWPVEGRHVVDPRLLGLGVIRLALLEHPKG